MLDAGPSIFLDRADAAPPAEQGIAAVAEQVDENRLVRLLPCVALDFGGNRRTAMLVSYAVAVACDEVKRTSLRARRPGASLPSDRSATAPRRCSSFPTIR